MSDPGESHPLVKLARKAIMGCLSDGAPLPEMTGDIPGEPAGVFVSLKKDGQLRGCIGTLEAFQSSLAEEVARNAVSAATRDPRFSPVTIDELEHITISVDVLSRPEAVSSEKFLEPSRYGVVVRSGTRKGVLLPDLPGITTSEEQVRIARQKAGIGEDEEVELQRFEVRRYK